MANPVVLRGEHVVLEPLAPDHVEGLVAAASEDRSTYDYTYVPADAETMARYVELALADVAQGRALPFATRAAVSGQVVGTTRFLDLQTWLPVTGLPPRPAVGPDLVPTVVEIGATWLAASAMRSAVNTESKLLLLGHAFETWQVLRVTLKTDARNARSRAAIERLGARAEGVRRADMPAADGGIRDTAYFSIVADEWPDVRARLVARLAAGAGTTSRSPGPARLGGRRPAP
jgi:N-acetyltransferase